MNSSLEKLLDHQSLSREEAHQFIHEIDADAIESNEISAILIALRMKGLHLEELQGFRDALLELCRPISLDASNAIDVCGTGGDGKNTFNISTGAAIILSAMGTQVVKHGNYGVSSRCGSSTVLEALGISFTDDSSTLERQLKQRGICFVHAPLFHPTVKKVMPVRKALATRTVFNCLGPLVNPAQPGYQLTGTFSSDLMHLYGHLLRGKRQAYAVVHNLDGYDEVTLTDSATVISNERQFVVRPEHVGVSTLAPESLYSGEDVNASASLFLNILKGEGSSAQHHAVAINVALGLQLYHPETKLDELFTEALSVIQSGKGYNHFKKIAS